MSDTTPSRRLTRAGWLLLPVVTAWAFIPQLAGPFDIKLHILYLGTMMLLLFMLRDDSLRGWLPPRGALTKALLLWLAAVALSTLFAPNDFLARQAFQETAAVTLLALALYNLREPETILPLVERAILLAGLGVALFALKQHYYPDWLDPGFIAPGKLRIYSTLGNPDLSALVMLPGVVIAAWRTSRGAWLPRIGYLLYTLILLGALWFTQHLALLALLAAGLAGILWRCEHRTQTLVRITLVTVLTGCLLALLLLDLPPSLAHDIREHLFTWLSSLHMLVSHPLTGVGPGHFGLSHMAVQAKMFAGGGYSTYVDNASVVNDAHNDFLNWGATTGLAGLLGFTLLCAFTLRQGWRSDRLRQQAPQLYLALLAMMVAMLFVSLNAYTGPALFFWMLLGLTWAYLDPPRFDWFPSGWQRGLLTGCVTVFLALGAYSGITTLGGAILEARGDRLMEGHDLWLAKHSYHRALRWIPHNGRLRKKYATTLFLSGDLPEALQQLQKAGQDSADLGIELREGEVRTLMGDLDGAAAVYRSISAAFPNMVDPHFILGQIYLLQGQKIQAEEEFQRVLDIRPSPYNLNMEQDKIELQKRIVRDYLDHADSARAGGIIPALPGGPAPAPWVPH